MSIFDKKNPKKELEFLQNRVQQLEAEIKRLREAGSGGPAGLSVAPGEMMSIQELEHFVIQLDRNKLVNYANSTFCKEMGVATQELIGLELREIDSFPWGPGLLSAMVSKAFDTQKPVEVERQFTDEAGKEKTIKINVTLMRNGRSQIIIRDLSDIKNIKQMFERYVSPSVIDKMTQMRSQDFFKTDRYELTVLFADLRGFTKISERLSPDGVRNLLNIFLKTMIKIVNEHEATVDKVMGDCVMAICGAPIRYQDHAVKAVLIGLQMQQAHAQLMARWQQMGLPPLGLGIGINTGEMVVGNIGSEERSDYTVIGHHVNLGSRLCSLAGPGEIFLSQPCYHNIQAYLQQNPDYAANLPRIKFKSVGEAKVKNIANPVPIISASF